MGPHGTLARASGCLCSQQRLRWVFVCLVAMVLMNVLVQKLYFSIYKNTCSTKRSFAMIADTCYQYKAGVVAGSFCSALCDEDLISYRHCVNWRFGKIVAFTDHMSTRQQLVLKAMFNPSDNDYTLYDFIENRTNYTQRQLLYNFKKTLVKRLKDRYDFTLGNTTYDLLTYMWGYNATQYVFNSHDKLNALRTAIRSVWYLVQQREYVFSRIHENYSFATKIVGTCGAMYFLEYSRSISGLKSGLFRGRGLSIHTHDWGERAGHAIKILQLLPTLHTSFQTPLIMCDIKESNFGLGNESQIVLIDSDDIHYETSLMRTVFSHNRSCNEHWQCGHLTCPGICDQQENICRNESSNNELQAVCERVFLNKVGFVPTGLLSGAPSTVKKELSILLDKCAYPPSGISPTWDARHVIHRPPDSLRQSLIDVLKRGIAS